MEQEFKAFDKVLVRNEDIDIWCACHFSMLCVEKHMPYIMTGVNSYDVRCAKTKDRLYPIEIIGDFVDYIFSKKGVLSKYKKNKIKTS